jgi:hypothetical protein
MQSCSSTIGTSSQSFQRQDDQEVHGISCFLYQLLILCFVFYDKQTLIKGGALLTIGYTIFLVISHTPLLIAKYFFHREYEIIEQSGI